MFSSRHSNDSVRILFVSLQITSVWAFFGSCVHDVYTSGSGKSCTLTSTQSPTHIQPQDVTAAHQCRQATLKSALTQRLSWEPNCAAV